MASTPSASALSAVLRCRGNILSRNPPNKRPAVTQARSLGLACGAVRGDSTATTSERAAGTTSNSNRPASTLTTWKCFLRVGERRTAVSRGGRSGSSATVKSSAPLEEEENKSLVTFTNACGGINKNRHRESSPHWRRTCTQPEVARSYVTGAPKNAPAARTLQSTSTAPGIRRVESSAVFAAHVYAKKCLQHNKELPLLNVSVTLPACSKDNVEQMILVPLFILKGWSTLKNTCISLSILVSEMISFNLGVLSCSSPDINAREVVEQGNSRPTNHNVSNVQQVKGQMQPSDPLKPRSDSRPKSQENRPD